MDQDNINKIYEYNRLWLTDEKSIPESILENLEEEFFQANLEYKTIDELKKRKKLKQKIPNYLKGSLIGLNKSILLKEATQFKLFGYNILPDVLKVSQYCVPADFFRYKKCSDDAINRPLFAFFTTKENGEKLRYLGKQSVSYEYIAIDYSNVKYSKYSNLGNERDDKPESFRFKTKSKNFNNLLVRNDRLKKYEIPVTVDFSDFMAKRKSKLNELEIKIGQKEQELLNAALTNDEKKQIKENIKDLKKNILINQNIVTSGLISNGYILESDGYYRKLLEDFKKQVKKKANISINLEEWCYCIVFSSQWCDSNFIPDRESIQGVNIVQGIRISKEKETEKGFLEKYSKLLFNKDIESGSIDVNLLYFLEETFKQPPIKSPDLFLEPSSLDNFDIVFKAFEKYPDGGFWVKKIVKENKKFMERVIGPYKESDAKIQAKIHRNVLTLKEGKSAEVISFNQLVCQQDYLSIDTRMKTNKYVKIENRYTVPQGAQLFCLVHKIVDLVYFNKDNLTEKFRKFSDYSYNSGMRYISTFDYLIYYNPESKISVRKAGEMKTLLEEIYNYTDGEFIWLQDAILGREKKRGKKPSNMPFNIAAESLGKDRIDYQGLKDLYGKVERLVCGADRLKISFQNFYDVFGRNFSEIYQDDSFRIKTELNMDVIMDKDDDQGKKVKIIKEYDETYQICMKRRRNRLTDIDLISIKDIKDCQGYLDINFTNLRDKTWEISKIDLFSGDLFFNNETVLIVLMMFVAKCFGVRLLRLDTRLRNSNCNNTVMYHYYHIYYLAYGNFKKFEDLGFMVNNDDKYNSIVKEIKDMKLINFVTSNNLKIEVDNNYRDYQISQFCRDFLEADTCFSKVNLIAINQISAHIEKEITLEIFNDLDERSFEFLEAFITHQ